MSTADQSLRDHSLAAAQSCKAQHWQGGSQLKWSAAPQVGDFTGR